MSTLDLDGLNLLEGELPAGRPASIPIDCIDEDPLQPRCEFAAEALAQLAETIRDGGVRQPVSVRPHPERAGRYVLNFGARRLRASKLAGKAEIPVFFDEALDAYGQVIENEQREPLSAMELALFIKRRLDAGDSRQEIARGIGKSPQYVTYASTLIGATDWLMAIYRRGQCRGLLELHELARLHDQHPARVQAWAEDLETISRSEIQRLKSVLDADGGPALPEPPAAGESAAAPSKARRGGSGAIIGQAVAGDFQPLKKPGRRGRAVSPTLERRAAVVLEAVLRLIEEMDALGKDGTTPLAAFRTRLRSLVGT